MSDLMDVDTDNNNAIVPLSGANAMALLSPEDRAKLEREKRLFMSNMTKVADVDKALTHVHLNELTLPVLILGASKVLDEGYSKMLYIVFPDFRKFGDSIKNLPQLDANGNVSVVVDARGKTLREKDDKAKIDIEKEPIHNAAEVDGMVDHDGRIRRVKVTFKPGSFLSIRNDAKLASLKAGTFAVVNAEAAAWHGDDMRVAVSPKITGCVHIISIPDDLFITWAYNTNLWTTQFQTKVRHYANFRAAHPKATDDELAPHRYRNDNQFVVAIGFEDHLVEQMLNPKGCHLRDITDVSKENLLVDTRDNKNRYFANYQGCQWRSTAAGGKINTNFTIDIAFFNDVIDRIGISSNAIWKSLFPLIRSQFKAMVLGCEDAERTWASKLVRDRIFESEDPEYLNQPNGNNISFALGVNVRAVVFDPVSLLRTVGVLAKKETISQALWGTKKHPINVPAGVKVLQKCDPRIVCLSEFAEERREFSDDNYELRVVMNCTLADTQGTAQPLSVLGALSIEDGDPLVRYLAACVLAGQGANVSKQEYLEMLGDENPEERAKINHKSPINKYIFQPPSGSPIAYVFAINRKRIEDDMKEFTNKITRLGLNDIFANGGIKRPQAALPAPAPAPAKAKAAAAAAAPERAKSPERVAAKSSNGSAKRKEREIEEDGHVVLEDEEELQPPPTKKHKTDLPPAKKTPTPLVVEMQDEEEEEEEHEEEEEEHEED